MRISEKKQFNFVRSKAVLFGLLLILLILVFNTAESFYKNYQIREEISNLDKSIRGLEAENNELKREELSLTDDDFIEREAKLKLNFKKEGEEVVVLVGAPYDEVVDEEKEINISVDVNKKGAMLFKKQNFYNWLDVIFGKKI